MRPGSPRTIRAESPRSVRWLIYLNRTAREGAPYLAIVDELRRRHIPMIALDSGPPRDPAEFINAGHLNDRGAQRYSALLGQALNRIWGAEPNRSIDMKLRAKAP